MALSWASSPSNRSGSAICPVISSRKAAYFLQLLPSLRARMQTSRNNFESSSMKARARSTAAPLAVYGPRGRDRDAATATLDNTAANATTPRITYLLPAPPNASRERRLHKQDDEWPPPFSLSAPTGGYVSSSRSRFSILAR